LAVALFDKSAFQNCIVHGTILAKDGKKLSKSSKNYTDPMLLMKTYGTDAFRLYLYQTNAMLLGDLMFDEMGIQDAYQQLILPLWNAYNFFILYANIDGFYKTETIEPKSDNILDKWILAKLYDTEKTIRENMDSYQVNEYVKNLLPLIEGLTNWYIRRSRRRFWASGFEKDKKDAFETLYYVLVNTTKLFAPVAPIISEKLYMLLTEGKSVHLTDWPSISSEFENNDLLHDIKMMQNVIELARNIRNKNRIKNRQPLSLLMIALTGNGTINSIEKFEDIIKDELNIKNIKILSKVNDIATMRYDPNFNVIREKYPNEIPLIIKAIKSGKFTLDENFANCEVDGDIMQYDKDIVLITYIAKDGLYVASDYGIIVSLDITLTEELKNEGIARDIIRSIQDARKQINCDITDRICIKIEGPCPSEWFEVISKETLSSICDVKVPEIVVDIQDDEGTIKVSVAKENNNKN
jgi:isoleucyl-tRNA synthetase